MYSGPATNPGVLVGCSGRAYGTMAGRAELFIEFLGEDRRQLGQVALDTIYVQGVGISAAGGV